MAPACPPPPEPALRAFLDEVVVPILVERFLREHAGQRWSASGPPRSAPNDAIAQPLDRPRRGRRTNQGTTESTRELPREGLRGFKRGGKTP